MSTKTMTATVTILVSHKLKCKGSVDERTGTTNYWGYALSEHCNFCEPLSTTSRADLGFNSCILHYSSLVLNTLNTSLDVFNSCIPVDITDMGNESKQMK